MNIQTGHMTTKETAPARDSGTSTIRAWKILVIEDLPLVQDLMRGLLEEPGRYEICAMCEGEASALEAFDRYAPKVVIVDLKLKQGSGLGFLQQVRHRAPDWDPLLMVVTNHAIPALQSACLKAGAAYFFDKSRDLPRLRKVIDDHYASA